MITGDTYADLPKTAASARRLGLTRYFTGYPCVRGHIAPREATRWQCIECKAEIERRWRQANPDKHQEQGRRWRAVNPKAARAYASYIGSFRRAGKAAPRWVDRSELKRIYAECPDGMNVDHIIPIKHPYVCGLHVPANLQYMSAAENRLKGNNWCRL